MKIISIENRKIILMAIGLVAILSFITYFSYDSNTEYPEILQKVVNKSPNFVRGFKLIDHDEKIVTSDRFNNHWTFVFFGFTHCPDVCPATLSQLVRLNKMFSAGKNYSNKPQFFFVSVDPDRDTTKHLAGYIKYFDRSFVAMTGSKSDISYIEDKFAAFHKLGKKNKYGDYSVSHTANVFLVDPDGRYIANFEPPMDMTLVIKQFDMFVKRYEKSLT